MVRPLVLLIALLLSGAILAGCSEHAPVTAPSVAPAETPFIVVESVEPVVESVDATSSPPAASAAGPEPTPGEHLQASEPQAAPTATQPDPAPAEPTPTGRSEERFVEHKGVSRRYFLYIPDSAPKQDAPLLLMLHGGYSTAAQFRTITGMDAWANQLGFIVAYPEGTVEVDGSEARLWDGEHCCGHAHEARVNDVSFLRDVVEDIEDVVDIGHRDIVVAGHSNGGMMAERFAAEYANKVRAMIDVSGTVGGSENPMILPHLVDMPLRPVDVVLMHATDDQVIPYDGGYGIAAPGSPISPKHLSVGQAARFWRNADHTTLHHKDVNGTVTTERYWGGLYGSSVTVISTEGGHNWPGSQALDPVGGVYAPTFPDASALIARIVVPER